MECSAGQVGEMRSGGDVFVAVRGRTVQILGFDRADALRLLNFLKMGLRDRFLGSTLGLVWAIVNPLLMMGIFTFVFAFVFRSRLPGAETSLSFVIWLISGYGPWLAIGDSLATSTGSVWDRLSTAFRASLINISVFPPFRGLQTIPATLIVTSVQT